MSKKKTGLLIAVSAAIGAAAGISYYLKYKSFHDELDKDFHDYEDEDSSLDEAEVKDASGTDTNGRTYITLDSGKCKSGEDNCGAPGEEPKASVEEAGDKETDGEKTGNEKTNNGEPKPSAAVTVEEDTDGVNE